MGLKQWIGRHSRAGALDAIKRCGVVSEPGPAPCGGDKKPPPDSPKAERTDRGAADPAT
jgi:hypothetical protein